MRGMETLGNFEIYIPREAEVKTVPIGSLRVSVQQRLGVQRSHCRHRRSSNASAIWISPVVIRERARSPNKPDTSDMAKYNMASVVTQELKTIPGPYHMAFVSSNCVALRVLGEFLEVTGNGRQMIPAQRGPLPHGTATRCPKDAIIIHQKRIFLSFTKPDEIRGREHFMTTPALNVNSQKKLVLESSAVSAKRTCHPVAPDAACDDSRRERAILQRFGVTRFIQVTLSRLPSQHQHLTPLPSTSQQQPTKKDLHTNHNADKQVASNGDGSSTTPNTDLKQGVKDLSKVENDPMNLGDDQSPSKISIINTKEDEVGGCTGTAYSPKNCEAEEDGTENVWEVEVEEEHGTDRVCDVKGKEEIDNGSGTEPHITDFNSFVIEGDDPPSDTAEDFRENSMNVEMEDYEDVTVGSRGQSWGVDIPVAPAFSTPEPQSGFDFDQLAREEAIDRIRAKLRESEAALCSLRSLR